MFGFGKKQSTKLPKEPSLTTQMHNQRPSQTLQEAPRGVGIHHDDQLIARLKDEHQHLLSVFTTIKAHLHEKNWELVRTHLTKFRTLLVDHLIKEGVKLYAYGAQVTKNEEDLFAIFRGFKFEMGKIGQVVFNFIDQYSAPDALTTEQAQETFASTLDQIGGALVDRIKREEATLYPLYEDLANLNQR